MPDQSPELKQFLADFEVFRSERPTTTEARAHGSLLSDLWNKFTGGAIDFSSTLEDWLIQTAATRPNPTRKQSVEGISDLFSGTFKNLTGVDLQKISTEQNIPDAIDVFPSLDQGQRDEVLQGLSEGIPWEDIAVLIGAEKTNVKTR